MYSDDDAAALYDIQNPWDTTRYASDAFYHALVMSAGSVLDVGCGTGAMLHHARDAGHSGRLCGLDPDRARLDRARRRTDIEWVLGTAASARWDREFELAIMASNTFQVFVEDDDVRASLAAIRAALVPGGQVAFGSRHPQARAWENWTPDNATDVVDAARRTIRVSHRVAAVVGDVVVTFSETVSQPDGTTLRVDHGRLRFLDVPTLSAFLIEAGLAIDEQYGDWARGPLTDASKEIVTVARRV
ncbi:MAG TPA: class I SAM-dependent methyltransferase [Micromonosporaceae bacterium]|nr:class I SAM-dependent methyltransferase [Micromonosporaceae bacterium]